MKSPFKKVTAKSLKQMSNYFYGGGRKLKVGDKTIAGLNVMYANLYGTPPSKVDPNDIGLALQMFVLDESNGMIYQLYNKK